MAGVSWTWARGMDMDMVLLILAGSIDMNGTCHLLPTPSTNLARKQSSEQISPNTRHTLLTHARAMHFSKSAVLLAVLRVAAEGTTAYPPMGPAAFMWPTDRPWSADTDNIAPCGSSSGVGPRTEFPMSECTSTDLAQRKHDQSDEHDYHAQYALSRDAGLVTDKSQQMADLQSSHRTTLVPCMWVFHTRTVSRLTSPVARPYRH